MIEPALMLQWMSRVGSTGGKRGRGRRAPCDCAWWVGGFDGCAAPPTALCLLRCQVAYVNNLLKGLITYGITENPEYKKAFNITEVAEGAELANARSAKQRLGGAVENVFVAELSKKSKSRRDVGGVGTGNSSGAATPPGGGAVAVPPAPQFVHHGYASPSPVQPGAIQFVPGPQFRSTARYGIRW